MAVPTGSNPKYSSVLRSRKTVSSSGRCWTRTWSGLRMLAEVEGSVMGFCGWKECLDSTQQRRAVSRRRNRRGVQVDPSLYPSYHAMAVPEDT